MSASTWGAIPVERERTPTWPVCVSCGEPVEPGYACERAGCAENDSTKAHEQVAQEEQR